MVTKAVYMPVWGSAAIVLPFGRDSAGKFRAFWLEINGVFILKALIILFVVFK